MRRWAWRGWGLGLAGAAVLLLAGPALAQTSGGLTGSSGGFTGSSGGLTGSSGGFTGSSGGLTGSSGGLTGSSSSSGNFTGNAGATGTFTGSFTGATASSSSRSTYGSTGPMGRYMANPLAIGFPSTQTTTNRSGGSTGNQTLWYTQALPFGTPTYGTASLMTTTTGTTGTLGSTGSLGGSNPFGGSTLGGSNPFGSNTLGTANQATRPFTGASSIGVRRAPAYTTTLAFDYTPRTATSVRTDLDRVLSSTSRLPSRDSIRFEMDGSTVVLRGQVRNERERRLAEALVRLTPGVREVRNELVVPKKE
jgi:hypothetical protein